MPETSAIPTPKCPYCGSIAPHNGVCFMVKAIEYFPDGSIKRVELKTAHDYPQQVVSVPSVFGVDRPFVQSTADMVVGGTKAVAADMPFKHRPLG